MGLFGRRLGLRPGAATLAGLFYLLMPMVAEQIGHVRNDVAGAAVVAVTVAFLAGGSRDGLPGRLTLGMLGIGMMLVTKLALLPAAGAMSLVVLWILVREHRSGRDMRPVWRAFGLGVLLVAGLAVAPWWLRNLLREGNPLFPLDLPIIGRGDARRRAGGDALRAQPAAVAVLSLAGALRRGGWPGRRIRGGHHPGRDRGGVHRAPAGAGCAGACWRWCPSACGGSWIAASRASCSASRG